MENSPRQHEETKAEPQSLNGREQPYLTTENSPELKAAMDKISAQLLTRNKNLYRRLANAC